MLVKVTNKLISDYANKEVALRPMDTSVVEEYAESMRNGASFPAITLGEYPPEGEKDTGKAIIDGIHRVGAFVKVEKVKLDAEVIKYKTKADAMADMMKRNEHGVRLLPEFRDARIRMLHALGWAGNKIADLVHLSGASITRILQGKQSEGKGGTKKGQVKGRAGLKALSPKPFESHLKKIRKTLVSNGAKKEICDYVYAVGEENAKPDQDFIDLVEEVKDQLVRFFPELEKYSV